MPKLYHHVELDIGGMTHWRNIARSVKAVRAKRFAKTRQFSAGVMPPMSLIYTNKVDQLVDNQRFPFERVGEEFAHRNQDGGVLADDFEPFLIFGASGSSKKKSR